MKLYMHPASTASRPIMLFLAENHIDVDQQVVDLFTGEHLQDEYRSINPNCLVPALHDDELVLTESSAILKYLAEKHRSDDYPRDLVERARVNERMDWFNSNLYKDLGYNLVYPQLFPHHQRGSEAAQRGTVEWGVQRTRHWLGILDQHLLDRGAFLCGDRLTIADYFGACIIELGKAVRCDYSEYAKIDSWMQRMHNLPSWNAVHDTFYGFIASLEGKKLTAI